MLILLSAFILTAKLALTQHGNSVEGKSLDGGVTTWGEWSTCTLSCGGGGRFRDRICTNPQPQVGGHYCQEILHLIEHCNQQPCPQPAGTPTLLSTLGLTSSHVASTAEGGKGATKKPKGEEEVPTNTLYYLGLIVGGLIVIILVIVISGYVYWKKNREKHTNQSEKDNKTQSEDQETAKTERQTTDEESNKSSSTEKESKDSFKSMQSTESSTKSTSTNADMRSLRNTGLRRGTAVDVN